MKTCLAIDLIVVGTTAHAHSSGVKDPDVMNRMMGMMELAKSMKSIGMMAKGEAAFDAAAVNAALAKMSEEASHIPSLFETEADDPKSEALPAIWNNFDDFTAKAHSLKEITASLSGTVDDPADLGPVMREVGKTCSACHGSYRE